MQRFDQARHLAQAGPSEEALQTFQKLHQDYPDPRLLYWIARLLHLLGRSAEAIPIYRQFIDSGVERDPGIMGKARTQLAAAQSSLPTQTPTPTPASPVPGPMQPVEFKAEPINPSMPSISDDAPPPSSRGRPVYKRAWFWGLLGGVAAAGIVVGVSVGVATSTAPSDTRDLRWIPTS